MPRFLAAAALLAPWLTLVAAAQTTVRGTVRDAQTQAPVPFANLELLGQDVGTVADEQGAYALPASARSTDSVRVFSLGFRPRVLAVSALAAQPAVLLMPAQLTLREVRVTANSPYKRTHTLGSTSRADMAPSSLGAEHLGAQMGTIIHLKRRPSRVLSAGFNLARDAEATVTCRLHFYRVRPDGWPTEEKLLERNVLVRAPVRKGSVTFELADEQLVLDENFLMAVELVKWEGAPGAELVFATTVGSTSTSLYYRKTSQVTWKRTLLDAAAAEARPILSFFVTVQD
jgi:hypothetical protein